MRNRLVNFGVIDSLAFEFGFWLVAREGGLVAGFRRLMVRLGYVFDLVSSG